MIINQKKIEHYPYINLFKGRTNCFFLTHNLNISLLFEKIN